ncbi:MAG: UPF0280 family protein, partial [Candidatus Aerophobetes bacterium]|nr:UPF0280 family protein [Candidatus Aerophobetes bacterium]
IKMEKKIVYRDLIKQYNLLSFQVNIKESDLFILCDKKLPKQTENALIWSRKDIEQYIYQNPVFKTTFEPFPVKEDMPPIVRAMAEASQKTGVGPMASVAGAIAEYVGRELLNICHQVIVENGGDIFLKVNKRKKIGIYAGESPLSGKIALEIEPEDTPLGICCSAGTFGHSKSLGRADAVVVLSSSAILADAAATAAGNIVETDTHIREGLEFLKEIPEVKGGVIIKGGRIGAWGNIKIVRGI